MQLLLVVGIFQSIFINKLLLFLLNSTLTFSPYFIALSIKLFKQRLIEFGLMLISILSSSDNLICLPSYFVTISLIILFTNYSDANQLMISDAEMADAIKTVEEKMKSLKTPQEKKFYLYQLQKDLMKKWTKELTSILKIALIHGKQLNLL